MTSTSMPWIKLYTEMLDDAKLLPLSDPVKWRFVQLILLAGDCDQGGWLANNIGPLPVNIIALRLRVPVEQLKKDLACLQAAGLMIFERKTCAWMVTNFEKRQGRPQSKKREMWRENKKRQRRVLEDTVETHKGVHNDGGDGVLLTEEDLEGDKDLEEEGESGADAPATNPLPAPVRVYEENGGKYQSGSLVDGTSKKDYARAFIVGHIKDTPESLNLWGKVVFAYQAQWSPKSYTVMVNDYYLRGRIPGQSSGNGHQPSGKYDALLRSLETPDGNA